MSFDAAALVDLQICAASYDLRNHLAILCQSGSEDLLTIEQKVIELARKAQAILAVDVRVCSAVLNCHIHEIAPVLYLQLHDRIWGMHANANTVYLSTFNNEESRKLLVRNLKESEQLSTDELLDLMKPKILDQPTKSKPQV